MGLLCIASSSPIKCPSCTRYRQKADESKTCKRSKTRLKGSVYSRHGKLWIDFRYLGERVREPSGLNDTPLNRKQVRKQLNLIMAKIENGLFEFAKVFPRSKKSALKWTAIDDEYIYIELSRVCNREKEDLKTEDSRRQLEIRPALAKVLEAQWELTKDFKSPYVFINTLGRPILQDKLKDVWARAMAKSG